MILPCSQKYRVLEYPPVCTLQLVTKFISTAVRVHSMYSCVYTREQQLVPRYLEGYRHDGVQRTLSRNTKFSTLLAISYLRTN